MKFTFIALVFVLSCVPLLDAQEIREELNPDYPLKYEKNGIQFAFEPTVFFQANSKWTFGREPVLRRMPDGSLVSLIYSGGKGEPSPENVVLVVRSEDDGQTWTEPQLIFSHSCRSVWGTELFAEGAVPFMIFQTFVYESQYGELRSFMSFTKDNGKTWEPPVSIPGTPPNFSVRQGKVLSDGSWIFPIYWVEQTGKVFDFLKTEHTQVGNFVSGVIRSTDEGKTFTTHGYLTNEQHQDFWEPEIIELSTPGHLLMLIRVTGGGGFWKSESLDYGQTWSPVSKTTIGGGESKISMYRFDGDKIVLFGNFSDKGRCQLNAYVSCDEGKSWASKVIVANSGKTWSCYPHGFVDDEKKVIYIASDSVSCFYLLKIPFDALK